MCVQLKFVLLGLALHNSVVLVFSTTRPNHGNVHDELKNLCKNVPSSVDLMFYRYHPKTKKCYQTYRQGPCGVNMDFFEQPNSTVNGVCDCTRFSNRPIFYHESTDKCYYIFQKAYCPQGKWLTLSRSTKKPICETNPCQSEQDNRPDENEPDFVVFNGKCVQLGSNCEEHKIVDFTWGELLPQCTYRLAAAGGIGNIQEPSTTPCPPNAPLSISGRCQPSWEW